MIRPAPRRCIVLVGLLLMSACSSLPTSGPSSSQVDEDITDPKLNPLGIKLVDLSPDAVRTVREKPERPMSVIGGLRSNRAIDRLGPGDVLSIAIYEAGNGLFSSRRSTGTEQDQAGGSSAETLPRVMVDRNGTVAIPFAGQIRVAGHTTTEVQRIIESRLADRAAQPQVVVSLVTNGSNIAYVSGDVRNPGRYPLSLAHENLLDMVSLAGGPTHSPQDTLVKVNRRGRDATTSLTRIQTITEENIPVEPQDRIQVDYLPRSYLSFGATGRVAQIPFDQASVSLAEAIGRVGGLDDNRANPEAVYLFRYERPVVAQALGLTPTTPIQRSAAPLIPGAIPDGVPIVYRVNMRQPQTFFAIQQFAMQDKDLIYIANAPTVQIYKFLQLLYTLTSPAVTARQIAP